MILRLNCYVNCNFSYIIGTISLSNTLTTHKGYLKNRRQGVGTASDTIKFSLLHSHVCLKPLPSDCDWLWYIIYFPCYCHLIQLCYFVDSCNVQKYLSPTSLLLEGGGATARGKVQGSAHGGSAGRPRCETPLAPGGREGPLRAGLRTRLPSPCTARSVLCLEILDYFFFSFRYGMPFHFITEKE